MCNKIVLLIAVLLVALGGTVLADTVYVFTDGDPNYEKSADYVYNYDAGDWFTAEDDHNYTTPGNWSLDNDFGNPAPNYPGEELEIAIGDNIRAYVEHQFKPCIFPPDVNVEVHRLFMGATTIEDQNRGQIDFNGGTLETRSSCYLYSRGGNSWFNMNSGLMHWGSSVNVSRDYDALQKGYAMVTNLNGGTFEGIYSGREYLLGEHSADNNEVGVLNVYDGGFMRGLNMTVGGHGYGFLNMLGGTIDNIILDANGDIAENGSDFNVGARRDSSVGICQLDAGIIRARNFNFSRIDNTYGRLDGEGNPLSQIDITDCVITIVGDESSDFTTMLANGNLTGYGVADTNHVLISVAVDANTDINVTTVTGYPDSTKAWSEVPADGSAGVADDVVLTWLPGNTATTDTSKHLVYVGTDETAVTNATAASDEYRGSTGIVDDIAEGRFSYDLGSDPCLSPLVEGQDYFWRIDTVGGDTGDVWALTVGGVATNPVPEDGATDVPLGITLEWDASTTAALHDVYFGTNPGALVLVPEGNDLALDHNYLAIGTIQSLALNTTYYWKVVEVNGVRTWEKDTWSFTTESVVTVDSFDSYSSENDMGNNTWICGFGYAASDGRSRSEIGLTGAFDPVLDGEDGMKFTYDNSLSGSEGYFSEAYAIVSALPDFAGNDFRKLQVAAIDIPFYGDADNDTTQTMYCIIEDSTEANVMVEYGDNADEETIDLAEEKWHVWMIDLKEFEPTVDLSDVNRLYIGFGDRFSQTPAAVGDGTVYFDEITLSVARCVESRLQLDGDIDYYNDDCSCAENDLREISDDWLLTGGTVTGSSTNPGTTNLVAWYQFEGDYTDSSGTGNNGTAVNVPQIVYDDYLDSNVVVMDEESWVAVADDASLDIQGAITVSAWIKPERTDVPKYSAAILNKGAAGDPTYDFRLGGYKWGQSTPSVSFVRHWYVNDGNEGDDYKSADAPRLFDNDWHHVAVVYDGDSNMAIYYDSVVIGEKTDCNPNNSINTSDDLYIGDCYDGYYGEAASIYRRQYKGAMDDVRIYARALSQEEINYLAGVPMGSGTLPLRSIANLYEEATNDSVNMRDLAMLALDWRKVALWPAQ
jgi:hypothetical protein